MAYHKWDAEYWQGEYQKVVSHNQELRQQITKLQDELGRTRHLAELSDIAKRPILFVQEHSVKSLPEYVRMIYTVIEYKAGYNKPEILTAHNPF